MLALAYFGFSLKGEVHTSGRMNSSSVEQVAGFLYIDGYVDPGRHLEEARVVHT